MRGLFVAWFRATGWRIAGTLPDLPKMVICGASHTSNWDFLVFVGAVEAVGRQLRFVGKHTLFKWPMEGFMRGLGGVPVNRSSTKDMVQQTAAAFAAHDDFLLVVAPEGTRSKVDRWRTGFYRIAMEAKVPIVCASPDYANKRVVFGPLIWPTGNYDADMAPAFAFFRTITPRHPDRMFIPD